MGSRLQGRARRGAGRHWGLGRRLVRFSAWSVVLAAALFGFCWMFFPLDRSAFEDFPCGMRILDRDGGILRVYPSARGEMCFPVPLDAMSPWLLKATIAVEDRRFRTHPGIDPAAVLRAAVQNLARGRVHSGASTLTMQLVRIVKPRRRTIFAKCIEAFRALQLEAAYDKDRILEFYLNYAPYGGNIRGVEAAALRYFGKRARDLSLGEAALLAGLPQSPSRLRPDRHYERALARRRTVLEAMLDEGYIDAGTYRRALASRPRVAVHPWPFRAPHFADLARRRARRLGRTRGDVTTTLDPGVQVVLERELARWAALAPPSRADLSAAAVAIDVTRAEIAGYAGSPDFFSVRRAGQVDCARAPRSAGSTLKPFLYGLAFALGLAGPSCKVADVPFRAGAYRPLNDSKDFEGLLEAGDALRRSRNVPAVRLLQRIGIGRLAMLLREAGLDTIRADGEAYGLPLVLGGAEVRLLDLTGAYASLPRLGVHRPVRVLKDEPDPPSKRILSRGAARLLLETLSTPEHLERGGLRLRPPGAPAIAYKTGTSFGFRDAWTVAFGTDVVVGVWIGSPSGRPVEDLTGLGDAAPLALGLLEEAPKRCEPEWPGADEAVALPVCAVSGYPLGRFCPRRAEGRFAARGLRPPRCPVHRRVLVDVRSGFEVCAACPRSIAVEERTVEVWPPEVEEWLRARGSGAFRPPHHPRCRRLPSSGAIEIAGVALDGSRFKLLEGAAFPQRIEFRARGVVAPARVYWFIDGEAAAVGRADESFWWEPLPGRHEVRCADDTGRAAAVRILVEN